MSWRHCRRLNGAFGRVLKRHQRFRLGAPAARLRALARYFSRSFIFSGNKCSSLQSSTRTITSMEGIVADKKNDLIDQPLQNLNNDGVDRRGFLKCMAWAGTGLIWTMSGGIPTSQAFAKGSSKGASKDGDFSFAQISDSHMGFNKPANQDVTATLRDRKSTRLNSSHMSIS